MNVETLLAPFASDQLWDLEAFLADWFFVISLGLLAIELARYAFLKKLGWSLVGDTLANFVTQALYIGIGLLVFGALYISAFYYTAQFALFEIETTWLTVAICIVLADVTYYWEHRFSHRVGVAWATHTVHHSSPNFNLSVAYRFGPLDDLWPIPFHLPLVLLGFDPVVVFFSEIFVLLYQTFLHTEVIGKLPRPIEAIMNTPSHHRVHHGSNPQYLDKNYAGMFIVWDRLFGTFEEEREPVVYGITEQLETVNPLTIFTHGLIDLGKKVYGAEGIGNKLAVLVRPPDWSPKKRAGGVTIETVP